MLSLVTYLAVFILKIIESTRDIGRVLKKLFLIIPQVRFQQNTFTSHFSLAINQIQAESPKRIGEHRKRQH